MKTLKYSFGILLSFLAIATFSSCEEKEAEYTPATPVTSEQVAFAKSSSAQIDIAPDTKSFDIPVTRANAGAAISVPVTVTADSLANTIFEFPATIEFADSVAETTYTIAVKEGAVIEYSVYHNITIDIEESMTSPYVKGSYSFAVGAPEPWSEWTLIDKEAAYVYGIYWSGTLSGAYVYYREYMLNDTDAQFLLPEMAGGYDLTINYNRQTGACEVPLQHVADNSTYGPVYVSDIPNYLLSPGTYEDFPCTFNKETGLFELNVIYWVSAELGSNATGKFGNGVETLQLSGYEAPVVADHSFAMEFKGHYVDNSGNDNAVIKTSVGADIAQYLMTVISENENAQETITGMLDGSVACDTLTEAGFYAYPITESGNYKALAITFDAEGNTLDAYATDFEFYMAGQENPWVSLGMATYTEDLVTTFFNVENRSYQVEVRENKDKPGLYRVINPYGAAYPYNEEGDYDTSKEYFIEIDATDPDGVYIPNVYGTGMNWGYGEFSITSMAYYYMAAQGATFEEVKDGGYCGILADNVITFPAGGLLISMADYKDGNFYKSNNNGAFKLDMSDMTPAEAAPAKAPAARINGERELNNVEGGLKLGIRAKKIDNSFLTIEAVEI